MAMARHGRMGRRYWLSCGIFNILIVCGQWATTCKFRGSTWKIKSQKEPLEGRPKELQICDSILRPKRELDESGSTVEGTF
ncbi:hypothetical protein SAY86_014911 [Trapa natans]|uniref:Uncharacterized protein n=1 Tax=Trapa natans TaxID=22666 RepID=A0AAN7QGD4_TRANT|nr:hypothetical protein SAY86_014911 [Trapa natans]